MKSNLLLVLICLSLLAACSEGNSSSQQNATKAEVEPVEQIDDVKAKLSNREASSSLVQPKSSQSTTQSTTQEFPRTARLTAQQSNARINLRSRPSATSPDKGYGLVGDPVKLLDKAEGADGLIWYYAKFDASGAEGWIRSDFIQMNETTQASSDFMRHGVAEAAFLSSQQVDKLIELDSFSKHEFDGYEEGFEDSAKWNGMPFGIIVPTYIPPGFKITHFK
ncbi:SH3 domain-containing protein [Leptolyngbya sp. 7M]|uniref:SH3 domain-containing protein n=1 Tax=Leptolyngbya sp. 7M TaxID=2812896 RepID=UPI001B8A92C5|nr:SH3 domain-containing protein [Leptolyngbya sp. 7M]QYO63944.1 SH3 domain-containing protein [Leptolyngbya sp. 7M]